MKRLVLMGLVFLGLLGGCSADKSQELFDTAQFEEKQNNKEHAQKLYQEIIAKYPNSQMAKHAETRLVALSAK